MQILKSDKRYRLLIIVIMSFGLIVLPDINGFNTLPVYAGQDDAVIQMYDRSTPDKAVQGKHVANFKEEDFIGPHYCYNCHHLLTDAAGNNVSIISDWRSTMMANAAKDPFWQAKVQSEVRRNPTVAAVIEEKCTLCHMPMAWTQTRTTDNYDKPAMLGEKGYLNNSHKLHEAAMDGVSCTLCHQIQDKDLGKKKSFSGKFSIDTSTNPPDRIIFGPYENPEQKTMRTSVDYTPEFGPQTNDAGLCATCHTLFTPYLDSQGQVAGEFPEQVAYLEWQHSEYYVPPGERYDIGDNPGPGKICQECHMPHSPEGDVIIARWAPPEVKPKEHFSQHFFVGGNVLMLEILRDNIKELGLTASSEHFNVTRDRTLKLLQQEGARLEIVETGLDENSLTTRIKIENLAGHKFPTGFPSRRLWLHLTVEDKKNNIVFESGKPLENGAIVGNDNDANPATFEPHYDEISDPGQVQIYEAVMLNTDNELTYTLLRGAGYAKDNRLLPMGFDKASASTDIAVQGGAEADDDFMGGSDMITYRINTGEHKGPFTVRAELLYTTLSYVFLEDLKKDADLPLVNRFIRMTESANKMPVLITSASKNIR